jgi:heme/copper-type cytochrome/quinol oxidase subunit 1
MTTVDTRPAATADPATRDVTAHDDTLRDAPATSVPSLVGWLTASDHKIIGRLYFAGGVLGLFGVLAVNIILGIERVDGDNLALDANAFSQLFDAQRIGLVFGTLIPLGLGAAVVATPLQLGARALAFPRLAMLGFWLWLGGMVLTIVALARDGGTLGGDPDMVDLYIVGMALMAIGVTATAGAVGTTVLTTRAPGMTMRRVPFFAWSALVTAIGYVLVMPVFVGVLVYLFVDHRNSRTAFDGNSGIAVWAGWLFTQPATYLFALPAIGLLAESLPVTFKKRTPARGVMYGGLTLIGIAAFAAVTQQQIQRLPWAGSELNLDDLDDKVRDLVPYSMFNLLPILGMIVVVLMGLVLAKPGRDAAGDRVGGFQLTPAFVFSFFGYGMVLVGMLGTVLYAVDDLGLQGTVFEEAVLVYVAYGAVLGAMGAIAHWMPKISGHALSNGAAIPLALLGVAATVLAAFPHYIAGFLDQPSGVSYADGDLALWNVLSLVGHSLMAITVLAFLGLVAARARREADAGDDPWHGHTIEWATTSPAPSENFVDVPQIRSAEPMLDFERSEGVGS